MTNTADAIALVFMSLCAWREARGAGSDGITAVCFSILNRVSRPSWWGNDVLSVVGRRFQYSSMTNPGDPQLTLYPTSGDPSWQLCLVRASLALAGNIQNPVPGADSYYDTSIPAPDWTIKARFVSQIGRLRFYDVDHDYETEHFDRFAK